VVKKSNILASREYESYINWTPAREDHQNSRVRRTIAASERKNHTQAAAVLLSSRSMSDQFTRRSSPVESPSTWCLRFVFGKVCPKPHVIMLGFTMELTWGRIYGCDWSFPACNLAASTRRLICAHVHTCVFVLTDPWISFTWSGAQHACDLD
jgi:hypothetical protein